MSRGEPGPGRYITERGDLGGGRRAGRHGGTARQHGTARTPCRIGRTAGSFENQSAIETNGRPSRPRVTVGKLDSLSVTTGPLDI